MKKEPQAPPFILFELVGNHHFPIVFSKVPPVDGAFPKGAPGFGLGSVPFSDASGLYRRNHRKLLRQHPVAQLLGKYNRGALTLGDLVESMETLTGLASYFKRTAGHIMAARGMLNDTAPDQFSERQRWIRMTIAPTKKPLAPMEVDF